jgi:ribosomal protein S9
VAQITTGRRKEAVARVRLVPGSGSFELNGRSLEDYFPTRAYRMVVASPLRTVGKGRSWARSRGIEGAVAWLRALRADARA